MMSFAVLVSQDAKAAKDLHNASPVLIKAARDEIRIGSDSTSCSLYVRNVLKRASFSFQPFLANEFHMSMRRHLPQWKSDDFFARGGRSREALKNFLNSLPDNTAVLGQWPRNNQSGHVAVIVKESANRYRIYQAQQNRASPHAKLTTVEKLLYPRNEWGDRSHLRVFVE